eukprot:Clim_evm26s230 gene=Clim_evmTU26s230
MSREETYDPKVALQLVVYLGDSRLLDQVKDGNDDTDLALAEALCEGRCGELLRLAATEKEPKNLAVRALLEHLRLDGREEAVFVADSFAEKARADAALRELRSAVRDRTHALSNSIRSTLVGLFLLQCYTQHNITGPELSIEATLPNVLSRANDKAIDDTSAGNQWTDALTKQCNESVAAAMDVDGERCYRLAPHTLLLFTALTIADVVAATTATAAKASPLTLLRHLLLVRSLRAQHELIDERTDSVTMRAITTMERIVACMEPLLTRKDENGNVQYGLGILDERALREAHVFLQLDLGMVYHIAGDGIKSRAAMLNAQVVSGLKLTMTGVLGRRTQFQTFDTAQLALRAVPTAEVSESSNGQTGSSVPGDTHAPRNVSLNDDVLLDEIAYTHVHGTGEEEKEDQQKAIAEIKSHLGAKDQAIVLGLCMNVQNNNPRHGLTTEEMQGYVQRVLENSADWMVYTMALLLRSRLEANKSRTVERGVLQMQALVDQFNDTEVAPAKRLRFASFVAFPPLWNLRKELAEKYISIGVAATAMEMFKEMERWDEAVACLMIMDKKEEAEALARERLAVEDTPELWCALGDITGDPENYIKAFEVSGHKHARAMRSHGLAMFHRRNFAESLASLQKAVALNPANSGAWFTLGCAAIQLEDSKTAIAAFKRTVALGADEDPESWNNLASLYLKEGDVQSAFHALTESLKHAHDNWKIWENYMVVAARVGSYDGVLRAHETLVEMVERRGGSGHGQGPQDTRVGSQQYLKGVTKSGYCDLRMIQILVESTLDDLPDYRGKKGGARRYARIVALLTKLTGRISNEPQLWIMLAEMLRAGPPVSGADEPKRVVTNPNELSVPVGGDPARAHDCLLKAMKAVQLQHSGNETSWETDVESFRAVAHVGTGLATSALDLNDPRVIHSTVLSLNSIVKRSAQVMEGLTEHTELVKLVERLKETEASLR